MRVEFFGDEVERIVEVDPLTGEILVERTEIDIYPGQALRHDRRQAARWRSATSQPSWKSGCSELECQGKLLEAAAAQAAHDVRPGDAAGDGLLRRRRELLDAPLAPTPGRAALDADGLLPGRLPAVRRRVAHLAAAGARHVRRRPIPQGRAGRARLPAALRARQPAADASTSSSA